ncbi:hypothetical protein CLN94_06590 [Pseudothioclava arenosa]|uniref:MarR family transcriptional regulator n=2 Tax=Pseudothioclava arenosa TaxID=1795308 RepID=A0A2A4CRK0_9RHOB|nr:hypothetical protein CLN94_06590 [Pseudothioclava arenosa]
MIRVTAYLLNADPDMTVSRLNVFLHIASSKDGDVLVRDLCKKTGLGQSTVARTLAILSDKPMRGKKDGLGWVRTDPDPEDPRRVLVNLTSVGVKVVADLEALGD